MKKQRLTVAVGCDHRGYDLKHSVMPILKKWGYKVLDLGTHDRRPVDYPDYAEAVGLEVTNGRADRGILICGSGVGVTVAANKLPGIRACLCHDTYSSHQGVEHDDMNVLVLGALVVSGKLAEELIRGFLEARFDGTERHARRLRKIDRLERQGCQLLKDIA